MGARLIVVKIETMLRKIQSRLTEPFDVDLRNTLLARIKSGELTEDLELSSALDSLDIVQLEMEIEELGIKPTVPIKSVGDLLSLLRAIELTRLDHDKRPPQAL
jgi:acyl carrier protein